MNCKNFKMVFQTPPKFFENKADATIYVCKFKKKKFIETLSYWEFKDYWANCVNPEEVAHYEPPHLDLYCLQIQLFSFVALLVLKYSVWLE